MKEKFDSQHGLEDAAPDQAIHDWNGPDDRVRVYIP